MLWAWLPRKSGGAIQGRIQDFPNWGVETHGTKSGGGGVLYALGPIRKAVRGGGSGEEWEARIRGGYRILSSDLMRS